MNYQHLALLSIVISSILFALVIIYLFIKYLTPAVAAAQKTRNEEIAVAEQRRDAAVREAKTLRAQQEKLTKALEETLARSEVEARRERERIIAEARAEGERLVRHADGELDRARAAGQDTMQTKLIELALEKARIRAIAEVTADVDRGLSERFLDQVAQQDRSFAEVNGG